MSARDLSRQMRNVRRPKDRSTRGTNMAAIAPATAIDAAREYAGIAHAARIELHEMVRAAGVIFGTGFQLAAEELLEQHAEAHGEAVDMFEEARAIAEEWMAGQRENLRTRIERDAAEIDRLRSLLTAAWEQENHRRLRPGASRPGWFELAATDVADPF